MTNCYECKYISSEGLDERWCERLKCKVPAFYHKAQEQSFNCEKFEQYKTCGNCEHSGGTIYETGTIDYIDYNCKLQNGKVIYSDFNWENVHHYDFPVCPIGRWESAGIHE